MSLVTRTHYIHTAAKGHGGVVFAPEMQRGHWWNCVRVGRRGLGTGYVCGLYFKKKSLGQCIYHSTYLGTPKQLQVVRNQSIHTTATPKSAQD